MPGRRAGFDETRMLLVERIQLQLSHEVSWVARLDTLIADLQSA